MPGWVWLGYPNISVLRKSALATLESFYTRLGQPRISTTYPIGYERVKDSLRPQQWAPSSRRQPTAPGASRAFDQQPVIPNLHRPQWTPQAISSAYDEAFNTSDHYTTPNQFNALYAGAGNGPASGQTGENHYDMSQLDVYHASPDQARAWRPMNEEVASKERLVADTQLISHDSSQPIFWGGQCTSGLSGLSTIGKKRRPNSELLDPGRGGFGGLSEVGIMETLAPGVMSATEQTYQAIDPTNIPATEMDLSSPLPTSYLSGMNLDTQSSFNKTLPLPAVAQAPPTRPKTPKEKLRKFLNLKPITQRGVLMPAMAAMAGPVPKASSFSMVPFQVHGYNNPPEHPGDTRGLYGQQTFPPEANTPGPYVRHGRASGFDECSPQRFATMESKELLVMGEALDLMRGDVTISASERHNAAVTVWRIVQEIEARKTNVVGSSHMSIRE
ncbi:hypothetical protein LTR17_018739 [Elasticomyces elasticus]|nr:hypothetical protein LTR17_018739 [Elasticomyces elasticus]